MYVPDFIHASEMICQQIAVISKEEAKHLENKYARAYKLGKLECKLINFLLSLYHKRSILSMNAVYFAC